MVMQEDFELYAAKAKTLPANQTNEDLLIIYGLYKQATVGPVNTGEWFYLTNNFWILFINRIHPSFLNTWGFSLFMDFRSDFTARPGMFNMKDRAKWDAWKAVEGSR